MKVAIFDRMEQCTEQEVQRMLPMVSAQRREQALRFKHLLGQFCCLKSWLMLKELIGEVGEFTYNEHGKPLLPGGPYFSISHCQQAVAVAVDDQPIGIDIEHIRRAKADLIERTMNETERKQIKDARDFTRLWTQKEAVVKAQGIGITSFEQLQHLLPDDSYHIQTIENEKFIYSIAYGKLHCFSAKVQAADL